MPERAADGGVGRIGARSSRKASMNRLHALAASLVLAAALPALGQTPAPTAAAPAAPSAAPPAKHNCGAKPEHPGRLASDNMKRAWQRDANAYLECVKKFANEQQQIAQDYIKAANAAVDEYNASVKEFQAAAQQAAQ
jgi:hypothetical protein